MPRTPQTPRRFRWALLSAFVIATLFTAALILPYRSLYRQQQIDRMHEVSSEYYRGPAPKGGWDYVCTYSAGFPFTSHVVTIYVLGRDADPLGNMILPVSRVADPRFAWEMGDPDYSTPLPRRPLWLPLLCNTAVYSLACGILIACLRFITHARRRAALNLCPHCRYPLTGLPSNSPCPECGQAV